MFSLLISVIVSAIAIIACIVSHADPGGTIAAGIVAFFIPQLCIGFFIRKKIAAVQKELQEMLINGQKQANRKIQLFQSRPGGNIKQLQRQIETDQKTLLTEALAFTERFAPFTKWNLLMNRQIATMRMQFLYQLKSFDEVDQILATAGWFTGPMLMEPMAIAMKMARQYKTGTVADVEKTFNRRIKWFRGSRGTLLYGLMSWIYMKEGEVEKARLLLGKAKEITADETLARNWEMLSNCKDKHFSNAGLGDEWYGLYLETPPAPKQQRMRTNAHGGRRF